MCLCVCRGAHDQHWGATWLHDPQINIEVVLFFFFNSPAEQDGQQAGGSVLPLDAFFKSS